MASNKLTVASVDTDIFAELVDHVRNATTDQAPSAISVPTAHFTDSERTAAEITVLKRRPLMVGHISEIPSPGSFVTRTILGIPLLIVRQKDGTAAVFRNNCRHRGGRVEMAESGKRAIFMCQYHGWSYAAEAGTLKAVPFEKTGGQIDRQCNSLMAFKARVRHGIIFALLDDNEVELDLLAYLGSEIDGQLDNWSLHESIIYMEKTIDLDVNWKLVLDGAVDCIHPQFLHTKPGGVGSRTISHTAIFREYGLHGRMFMARARVRKLLEEGGEIESSSRTVGSIYAIYPNMLIIEAPEHIELWTVWPAAGEPGKSTTSIRFMVRPEIITPELEARVQKSWEILREAGMEEDFPMEAFIQENASSLPGGRYRYGANEKSGQHLHRGLFRDIDGEVEGPGTISFL